MSAGALVSQITRRSRSNLYYGFLALPRPRREALYALYAFCRVVDDIADVGPEQGTAATALRQELAGWREDLRRCFRPDGEPQHPIARRLQTAIHAYGIPREALEAILDGVEMDLDQWAYETADDLYRYCYRVASAVGLCAIEIFGYADPRARQYAVELGTALQLTNILRDVGADARAGRVYIPQQDLKKFGVTVDDLRHGRYGEAFVHLMEHEAERARRFYRAAQASFPAADGDSLVAAQIMGHIYYALLREIEGRRFQVFGERITLPARRKAAIAARCWAAARLRAVAAALRGRRQRPGGPR
jgi:phytoene synthase